MPSSILVSTVYIDIRQRLPSMTSHSWSTHILGPPNVPTFVSSKGRKQSMLVCMQPFCSSANLRLGGQLRAIARSTYVTLSPCLGSCEQAHDQNFLRGLPMGVQGPGST
ncbi:uncharacterized protein LOC117108943 [Anneissia japonica]|uniref:uncharacterized protein LOC117108943 n=1 Tax=Anneissia japonica TaxID=1529436 RepID=UPI0014255F87|nr:uncharacterized protein LOC117108943 [Anneissia japonica]